jgi:DNA-binding LacI/PurR family transcriptional regulator
MSQARVTLQDVADRLGMSHMTVSRALRGAPGVSPATSARVQAAVVELGYNPAANHAARRMAMQRYDRTALNQVIALFFPRELPSSAYFVRQYLGVLDEVEAHNFGLLTHYSNALWEAQTLPPLFQRGEIDGVIMLARGSSPTFVEHLRHGTPLGDRPIVTLIESLPGCSAVLTDDCQGGELAAGHLLDLGHRHLLHSAHRDAPHQQRLQGYRQAYAARGLEPARFLHECIWDNDGAVPPAHVFLAFLQAHPAITGVLAPNDHTALRMHQALAQAGLDVPGRISLVGFDDAGPLNDPHGEHFLTTVALPLEAVGREAVRLLLRHLADPALGDELVTLPVDLVARTTTAPLR